jgi:hypothetical protein
MSGHTMLQGKKPPTSSLTNRSLTSPTSPTVANPTRGFGLQTDAALSESANQESSNQQEAELDNKQLSKQETFKQQPQSYDFNRISMRPQAKLTINQPGDVYEQEADTVAQEVMRRMSKPANKQSVQRQQMPEEEQLQTKPLANSITPVVQREAMLEEDEQIQMKPEGAAISAPSQIESSLKEARGSGQPLGDDIRQPMEQAFGTDFSRVKIHTDSRSHELNKSVQSRAFTTGQDVFFRQGEYSPGNNGGKELLAHELTHVVQQNGGAVQRKTHQAANQDEQISDLSREIILSEPSQDIGIQRLCSSCEKEQQSSLKEEKLEEPLQAKKLSSSTMKISSDSEVLSNPACLQTKEQPQTTENLKPDPEKATATKTSAKSIELSEPEDKSSAIAEVGSSANVEGRASSTVGKATEGKNEELGNIPASPADKEGKGEEKAPQPNSEAMGEAPSPENAASKGTEGQNEGLENIPASPTDKAGEGEEKAPQPNSENMGEAPSPENAAEKGAEGEGELENIPDSPANKAGEDKDKEKDKDKDKEKDKDKDKDKDKKKAPQPNSENMGEAPSPENTTDKGAEDEGRLENIPAPTDKAGEGEEKAPNFNEDIGKTANREIVAEKQEATTAVLQAQAQKNTINKETEQLVSTEINFASPQKEEIDGEHIGQEKDNAKFLEQQKAEASNITNEFLTAAASRVQTITQLGQGVGERIQGSTENAKASTMAAVEQQKAVISTQIAQQREQAQTEAQETIAQIKAQKQTASLAIVMTTVVSNLKIRVEHAASRKKIDDSKQKQLSRLDEFYKQTKDKFRAAGTKVGDEAVAFGDKKAAEWKSQIKHKDDSFWKGPLSDNRLRARAKAAKEVAKQYKKGLIEEANKQADKVDEGKSKDREAISNLASKHREQLESLQKQSLENLNALRQQALSQGEEAETQLTQTANQTLQTTLNSLNQQEIALLQLLDGYGQRQVLAIERDAQKAISSIQNGINQAAASLQGALQETIALLQGIETPNPEELSATLAEIIAQFDSSVAKVQEQTKQGIAVSQQSIVSGGQEVVSGMDKLAQNGLSDSITTATEAKTTLAKINTGAADTFNQLQQAFKTTNTKTNETAVTGFGQTTEALNKSFDQANQQQESNSQKAASELENGLRGALHGDKQPNLESDIQKYADEAAKKEEPRGVKVLKAIGKGLLFVVAVGAAIVFGPAVIGAVGALAGALGAGAAAGIIGAIGGGAIIGAVAGTVIQIGNNAIDGKNLLDGIGKAALMGTIGGALGGAGGALGNALGQAGKLGTGLTQSVLKFGIDVGFNIAGIVAGDLAVGNPITAESILIGAAIGSAVYVSTANLAKLGKFGRGIQGMQARNFQAGEGFGTTLGSGIRSGLGGGKVDAPSVGRPDVNMPGIKPPATETSRGEGTKPGTEIPGVKSPETEMPRGDRSGVDTSSGTKPGTKIPGVKQPDAEVKAPETNTPNKPSTHTSEREIEPGIVAKETAVDGHEIKVLKDGRIIRCSDCGEIRKQYQDVLEQNPKLKQRLDEIEKINNPDKKAEEARHLEKELSQKQIELVNSSRKRPYPEKDQDGSPGTATDSKRLHIEEEQDGSSRTLKAQDILPNASGKKVLLLGEGDFSFSLSLAQKVETPQQPSNIVATSYETQARVEELYSNSGKQNIEDLNKKGIEVKHEVDATKIELKLGKEKFTSIVFNFPFVPTPRGATQIPKNVEMLKKFFVSAANSLEIGGKVFVTTKDYWHTRFKTENLAKDAGLSLDTKMQFNSQEFPGYEHKMSHEDKSANKTSEATVFVFIKKK